MKTSLILFGIFFAGLCTCHSQVLENDPNYQPLRHDFEKQINLVPPDYNKVDLEIKLWIHNGRYYNLLLVVIREYSNDSCSLFYYNILRDSTFHAVAKYDSTSLNCSEKWSSIKDTLLANDLYTLPTQTDDMRRSEPDSLGSVTIMDMLDGTTYTMELSTKTANRRYAYGSPKTYYREFIHIQEYGKVINILEEIVKLAGMDHQVE